MRSYQPHDVFTGLLCRGFESRSLNEHSTKEFTAEDAELRRGKGEGDDFIKTSLRSSASSAVIFVVFSAGRMFGKFLSADRLKTRMAELDLRQKLHTQLQSAKPARF